MAWIIGIATEDEVTELRRRGWVVEDPDEKLPLRGQKWGAGFACVFVDNDMFNIMSGPDWPQGAGTGTGPGSRGRERPY